jgi:hypothetical protein
MPGSSRRMVILAAIAVAGVAAAPAALAEMSDDYARTAGGLTVYLGMIPAELVKGPMHGGVPAGVHEYHLVAAVFDATTNARVSTAAATAQVSGLGLAGMKKKLEAMEIAGTTTYGAFFNLPGRDLPSEYRSNEQAARRQLCLISSMTIAECAVKASRSGEQGIDKNRAASRCLTLLYRRLLRCWFRTFPISQMFNVCWSAKSARRCPHRLSWKSRLRSETGAQFET